MLDDRLSDRSVLVVEDQMIVALDIANAFEAAGAKVYTCYNLPDAMHIAEQQELSAAVVDFGLGREDAEALFGRLNERNIVFVLHSGYQEHGAAGNRGIVIPKPADPERLIEAITSALHLRTLAIAALQSHPHGMAFDPERLVEIQDCFDEGWKEISGGFEYGKAEEAALKFAKILFDFAADDSLDGGNLTVAAIHEMQKGRPDPTIGDGA